MPRLRLLLPALFAALTFGGCAHEAVRPEAVLLPLPNSIEAREGRFTFTRDIAIAVPPGDQGARQAAEQLAHWLAVARRRSPPAISEAKGAIRFVRAAGMAPEGYRLDVGRRGVTITASDDAGLFYGAVTLWQLATGGGDSIAATSIADAPRFAWRGMMLDSARHFQSPAFVKSLIDWMALHKLNRLHWHLVDDQGWRIEIPKYPRLTEVGAWRVPASVAGAPKLPRTGGYYTQSEIGDIVAYAAARHVVIVPEIEMPGHALAAIRAYPELGVEPPPPGIESDWGVFPYLYNVDEGTFVFLEDVLGEVIRLFPSDYIHVGGDEAVKDQWKASPRVQARMRALGLRDEVALQSWFIKRIEAFLSARGRRLIGWDEILDGGIAPNATVMSWRGLDGAVAAARAGHDAVLAPAPILYLDHIQGATADEPPGRGGVVSLRDVYAFDPVPAGLGPEQRRHILGLQANLWTEHVRTEPRAAWMAFPRVSAVAELGWSGPGGNFGGFVDRLLPQLDRLHAFGLDAAASAFTPTASASPTPDGRALVTLASEADGDIRYTVDGRRPSAESALYSGPLTVAVPTRLRAAVFRRGKALPASIDRKLDSLSIRRRDDTQLKSCTANILLRLEDDAPAEGRHAFTIDVANPCWIYEGALLDGIAGIRIDVGQLPFNFQIGRDIEKIRFRPPATADGEFEVRIDGCEGERIAVLPLGDAARNPALTELSAPLAPRTGAHDLCLTYTANGPNPLWALAAAQLVPAQ